MANRTGKTKYLGIFLMQFCCVQLQQAKKIDLWRSFATPRIQIWFFLNFGICRKCKHCHLENGKFWSDQIFEFLVNFRPGNVWIPFYTTVLPIYLSIGRTREVVLFRQGACQVACLSRAVNLDHLTIRTFSKARSAKRSNATTEKTKGCSCTNHL